MYIKTKLGFNKQLGKIKMLGVFLPRLWFNKKWNSGEREIFFLFITFRIFPSKQDFDELPSSSTN